jgi:predicted RecA/RadA family phage recombinase
MGDQESTRAMNNYVQPGKIIQLAVPSGGVVSGTAYLIGGILAVATNTVAYASGATFQGAVEEVFTLPKATGTAWTAGETVYWDSSALNFTTARSGTTVDVGATACTVQASGDTTGNVRLGGKPSAAAGTGGVQDIVLTASPGVTTDGTSATLYVETTGTVTGVVPNGSYVGQPLTIVQSVAASTPVGTLTGLFATQANVAHGTLNLGTAVGMIFRGVWNGSAYRQTDALGGTGSSLSG